MKRICSLLFAMFLLVGCGVQPASAEGFQYQFLSAEEENGSGGPHSKALFMKNIDTGTVVYSMNADQSLPMASLTKIMTYIVAYETIHNMDSTVITVSETVAQELEGTGSSEAHLVGGEEYTGVQLLHMMMIPSGNDAALVLADYVDAMNLTLKDVKETLVEGENPDTPMTFVDLMNLKAVELGCKGTHFMNPHGLHDPEHYSTARDLMLITEYAMSLPDFTAITSKTTYKMEPISDKTAPKDTYVTTNKLLLANDEVDKYYTYANGIKTGSHNEAGYCIAASAQEEYTYVVIALGSPYIDENEERTWYHGEMDDAIELFRWAFTKLQMKTIVDKGELMGDVPLKYAWKQERIQTVSATTVNAILPASVERSSIISEYILPEEVEAPVQKGDLIGQVVLKYADEEVARVDLLAAESVERSDIMMTLEQGRRVFTSGWFLLIVGVLLLLIIVYVVLIIIYRKKQKRLKSVKRYRNF